MIKSSSLVFHETFQPEIGYIAKILKLASEEYSGNKFRFLYKGIIINHNKNRANLH